MNCQFANSQAVPLNYNFAAVSSISSKEDGGVPQWSDYKHQSARHYKHSPNLEKHYKRNANFANNGSANFMNGPDSPVGETLNDPNTKTKIPEYIELLTRIHHGKLTSEFYALICRDSNRRALFGEEHRIATSRTWRRICKIYPLKRKNPKNPKRFDSPRKNALLKEEDEVRKRCLRNGSGIQRIFPGVVELGRFRINAKNGKRQPRRIKTRQKPPPTLRAERVSFFRSSPCV